MSRHMLRFEFSAFDTLFFREARPMETVGASPLAGQFPPTARTMAGAVRSAIGEALGVDWHKYRELKKESIEQRTGKHHEEKEVAVSKLIGTADDPGIGSLELRGPFPLDSTGERLYPAPLHWLKKTVEKEPVFTSLHPGNAVECDLGKVCLPELTETLPGAKPLEQCWLTADDLRRTLSGQQPEAVIEQQQLFSAEHRLGIALNTTRRSAEENRLYQTVHARLQNSISIGVEITIDLDDEENQQLLKNLQQILRLGGEGRFAHLRVSAIPEPKDIASDTDSSASTISSQSHGLLLMLCTPANFADWLPPGFKERIDTKTGVTTWYGEIAEVKLNLLSAVTGKAVREGGWDLKNHRSRPAVSLVPAGSVYFFELADQNSSLHEVIKALHGVKIGKETALGRGELAAGYWQK